MGSSINEGQPILADTPKPALEAEAEADIEQPFVTVIIPDLFCSIMSVEQRINPHHMKVKTESDAWVSEIFGFNEEKHQKVAGIACPLLACMWLPDSDEYAARLTSDWLQWVFFFDDQFDEGILKDSPEEARKEVEATISLMTDIPQVVSRAEYPIRHMFYNTWERFSARSSGERKDRYRDRIRSYCNGVLGQVGVRNTSRKLTPNEYMEFRWRSIGVPAVHQLIELGRNIDIPNSILEHPSIMACERLVGEIVALVNDVVSYRKERAHHKDYFHNIVDVLCGEGFSQQEAMDRVGEMLNCCYRRWYTALADMPIYGEQLDRQLQKYIEGCRDIALGNLHWSFSAERYFGSEGLQVRKTRVLKVDSAPAIGNLGIGSTLIGSTHDLFT